MVGIIEGKENIITLPFKKAGNEILIIGNTYAELGGSEYHSVIYDIEGGIPPKVDETLIKKRWELIYELHKKNLIKANHDINKGGLVITIAEMCFKNMFGAELDLTEYNSEDLKEDILLFSETVGRFIIETVPNDYHVINKLAEKYRVSVKKLGVITDKPVLKIKSKDTIINLDVKKMKVLYNSTIPNLMDI
jgi:phosphoribosylformylglycinamidine synthase